MSDNQSAFDPDAMLDVLDSHAVRYVVIGGMSERMHGVDRFTQDLDVCVSSRGGNPARLAAALRELDAVPTGDWGPDGFAAPLDATFLADVHSITLTTRIGALDVILRVLPYGECEDLPAAPTSDGRLAVMPDAARRIRHAYTNATFAKRIEAGLREAAMLRAALRSLGRRAGVAIDTAPLDRDNWYVRVASAMEKLRRIVPDNDALLLADEDQWGLDETAPRPRIPYPESDGEYGGPPADDAEALAELLRQRAPWFVVTWNAFWWLEHYTSLRRYLSDHARWLLDDADLKVFALGAAVQVLNGA